MRYELNQLDSMHDFSSFSPEMALRYHQWYEKPPGSILASLEKKALSHLLSPLSRGSLLDVGCGTGYFTGWLAELGFRTVGVDESAPMLKAAQERYAGIPFLLASGEFLPFSSRSFDLLAFITSLEFFAHPQAALREAARVTRNAILLGVLNRWSPYGLYRRLRRQPPYHLAHLYSVAELKELLQSCLLRPFAMTWTTAILSSHFGYAPSRLPGGGFIAMRVDFEDPPGERERSSNMINF